MNALKGLMIGKLDHVYVEGMGMKIFNSREPSIFPYYIFNLKVCKAYCFAWNEM